MRRTTLFIFAALLACAAGAEPETAPIVVTGTVADEASKAAVLGRLREVYGAARVVDQLSIGVVSTPANWNAHLARMIGPSLKLVTRGQLKVEGNAVSVRGEVADEAQRQQVAADIAASLNPTYTIDNGLRVVAPSGQAVLDEALKDRIIEFESGKATLTDSGRAILDEMSVALLKVKGRKVRLIGHTDNAGARKKNLSLSRARAAAVKAYVVRKGVDPGSVAVSGEGPDHPVADNRTAAGKARNRRIEFKVM